MGEHGKDSEKNNARNDIVGGLFFLAFGLVTLGYIISVDYVGVFQASRVQLRETPATLNSIRVRERRGGKGSVTFELETEYTYQVDGVEYTGTRLGFGETQWDGGRQRQQSRKSEVLSREPFFVFVDARNPSRAMLFNKRNGIITAPTIILTCLGGFFSLVGGFHLIRYARRSKERRAE